MKEYKFSELKYIPADFERAAEDIKKVTERIKKADDVNEIISCIESFEMLTDEVGYAYRLAFIRSSLDCTDEYYQEAAQREGAGIALLDTSPFYRALLDSPFLSQLEKTYGPEFRSVLEQKFSTNAAGHEHMAREQVLISQYQQKKAGLQVMFRGQTHSEAEMIALFDDPDRQMRIEARRALAETVLKQKEALSDMLLELIELRHEIAAANGFENYLEYANAVYSRRGYGETEMTDFCRQVKEELVPFLCEIKEQQRQILGVDKLMSYDRGIRFADGNAIPAGDSKYLTERSKHMYDALSPELGRFFRGMVDTESLDVAASPVKVAGMGFCSEVRQDLYPYVFGNCNGTVNDVSVFTHEIGHAWQYDLTKRSVKTDLLREMPLDAVEIPSKTMELFSYPYAGYFFGGDADKFRQGHFQEALQEIASFCAIHELNTWIYTHVGASFDAILEKEREIEKQYDPNLDYGELEEYNAQGADLLRNMAVYMFPRYVISYALSEMCAMDMFFKMQENPEDAWKTYEALCASGGRYNYPDTLAQAGLEPAYAKGRVQKVVAAARDYMESHSIG